MYHVFVGSWYYLKSCFYLSLVLQSYPVRCLGTRLTHSKTEKEGSSEHKGLILSDKNEKKLGRSDNISGIFRDPHYPLMVSFPVTSPMGLRVPEITPWWILPEACGSLAYDPRVWSPLGLGILGMPPWGLAFTPERIHGRIVYFYLHLPWN